MAIGAINPFNSNIRNNSFLNTRRSEYVQPETNSEYKNGNNNINFNPFVNPAKGTESGIYRVQPSQKVDNTDKLSGWNVSIGQLSQYDHKSPVCKSDTLCQNLDLIA